MDIIFYVKPLADMLYQFQIFDYLLVAFCIICFVKHLKKIKFLCDIDFCIIAIFIMFFFSFLRNSDGMAHFFKISSGFLLYFLGRAYYRRFNKCIRSIRYGFIPVFIVIAISYITHLGFKQWGHFNTFSSFYYFKTDLALALAQCLTFFCIKTDVRKIDWFIICSCLFFTFMTNARAYYFIDVLILFVWFFFHKDNKKVASKTIHINIKFVTGILVILFLVLLFLNYLASFIGSDILLFQFANISDVYSDQNMQARNLVWADIYTKFSNSDFLTRLVGIDLCSDISYLGFDSHNMYLKILYSIGYLGVLLYLIFIYYIVKYLNHLQNRNLYYTLICLFLIYFFSGLSAITIQSTQATWFPMFFLGVCVTKVSIKQNNKSKSKSNIQYILSRKAYVGTFKR